MAPSEFDDKYDQREELRRKAKRMWRERHPDDPLGNNDRITIENEAGRRISFTADSFRDALRASVGDMVVPNPENEHMVNMFRDADVILDKPYRVVQTDEYPTDRNVTRMLVGEIPVPTKTPDLLPMEGVVVRIRVGDRIVPIHSDMLTTVVRPKPGDNVMLSDVLRPDQRSHAEGEGLEHGMPYEVVSVG